MALTIVAAGVAIAGAAIVTAMTVRGVTPVEAGHTPFHIGCTHHNHGPKWHENHGRTLGQPVSRFARPERDDPATSDNVADRADPPAKPGITSDR